MKSDLTPTQSTVPVPDPTTLTTEAQKLATANLKELLFAKIELLEKATDNKVASVNTLKEEKFKELHERLAMVERHRIEAKADNEQALQAALKSQKELFDQKNQCNEEANAKSEASVTKQLEALKQQSAVEREGLSERIDALKERIDRGTGKEEHAGESRSQSNWVVALIVLAAINLAGLIVSIIALFK